VWVSSYIQLGGSGFCVEVGDLLGGQIAHEHLIREKGGGGGERLQ
jgi:hypothetical protein